MITKALLATNYGFSPIFTFLDSTLMGAVVGGAIGAVISSFGIYLIEKYKLREQRKERLLQILWDLYREVKTHVKCLDEDIKTGNPSTLASGNYQLVVRDAVFLFLDKKLRTYLKNYYQLVRYYNSREQGNVDELFLEHLKELSSGNIQSISVELSDFSRYLKKRAKRLLSMLNAEIEIVKK